MYLQGMGFILPSPVAAITAAIPGLDLFSAGASLVSSFANALNIGAGRRVSDEIVPYQNEVWHQVMTPVSAAIDDGQTRSYAEWKALYDVLVSVENAWLNFLHNTQWTDPRAPAQAETYMGTIFTTEKNQLRAKMAASGGGPLSSILSMFSPSAPAPAIQIPIFPTGPGPGVAPGPAPGSSLATAGFSSEAMVLVGGAAIALFLMRRKGNA